jgi:hypothetical protein
MELQDQIQFFQQLHQRVEVVAEAVVMVHGHKEIMVDQVEELEQVLVHLLELLQDQVEQEIHLQ